MTVAKKVTSLLLLLTLGSIMGILTFVLYLARTSSDAIFLMANIMEVRLLQQLQVMTLKIRTGEDDVRPLQAEIVKEFDGLVTAMESGGRSVRAGYRPNALSLLGRLYEISMRQELDVLDSTRQIVRVLNEELPEPVPAVRDRAIALGEVWKRLEKPLIQIAVKPLDDSHARAAYDIARVEIDKANEASRALTVAIVIQVENQRFRTLAALAGIGLFSVLLFVLGVIFARRYISKPIEAMHVATDRVLHGDFSHRVPIVSNDEIAVLAKRFNAMLDEVNRSVLRYRELFENAHDFVYIAGIDGQFSAVNRAAESISGYSRQELLQKRLDDIVAPDQSDVATRIRETISSGKPEAAFYELDIIRKDGSRVTLENSVWPMHDGDRTVGFEGVARDVTERKRLQEQLRVAQKLEVVGRLAGGIAHDFGNILTIINGYCSMILSSGVQDTELRNEVLGIQAAGQRAASLIRHLLTFSKVQIVRPRLIGVDLALAEMKDVLQRLVGENVQLNIIVHENIGSIRFDPTQLEQVIVNLVLNARDSMPSGGRISIDARVSNEQWVCITVTDTGHGMSPEVLSQIFEPFFSTKEQGTGLGLSTVHSIVQQAGGSIKASSEPYLGTTITVLFPRVDDSHDYPTASTHRSVTKGTGTILLVEDEDEVRLLIKQILSAAGYAVLEAIDQGHAVEICRNLTQSIDVMLTDVVMPRISGPQLAAEVRKIRPDLKVIYMSGYPRDRFDQDGHRDILHFIQKPIAPEDLRVLVRDVIDGAKNQPAASAP